MGLSSNSKDNLPTADNRGATPLRPPMSQLLLDSTRR